MSSKTQSNSSTRRYSTAVPFAAKFWIWSSITGKMTLLYALSAAAMTIICAGTIYWVLIQSLDRLTEQSVAAEIHDFRVIMQERPEDRQIIEAEVNYEGVGQFPWYYARILDPGGRTIIETREMGKVMPSSLFPSPSGIDQARSPMKKWQAADGRQFQMTTAWVTVGHSGGQRRLVQLALDVSGEEAIVANFRRILIVVYVLGVCVAAVVGFVVARLGMRPLSEITNAMQRIRPTQLSERVGSSRWPQELKALASALDKMLGRLEDSFSRLSQVSADLAHELRTPINNLMGEAEVALSKARTANEYRHVIESSLEEMGRLSRLVDNLLFLARAEHPEAQISLTQFDARKAIETVFEFHSAVAQEQGIEIQCDGEGEVHADSVLFRQAVSNLLSNALRYTPRGGQVKISVGQPDGQWVEVKISDTGSGIEPDHLPRVFDRFYRSDQARSQHPHGSGLGLSIVKSIMSLHGGEVTVASTLGSGTVVCLRFPSASHS